MDLKKTETDLNTRKPNQQNEILKVIAKHKMEVNKKLYFWVFFVLRPFYFKAFPGTTSVRLRFYHNSSLYKFLVFLS